MFAQAVRLAGRFTRPVIISRRRFDRSTECGCAAFVLLNDEGWIATAAHLLRAGEELERSARAIDEYFRRVAAVQKNRRLSPQQRRRRVLRIPIDPGWITHVSYWWGQDGVRLVDVRLLQEGDLAVGRLEPFDRRAFGRCAVIKNPARLDVGTPLCKLGYPFERIEALYDEAKGRFEFATGPAAFAGFPLEGIYTRTLCAGRSADGRYEIKFLETSSPGLTGHSGGPLIDARGTVWGIQSRTDIHPLRVPARHPDGRSAGEEVVSVNLGVAVHPELIVRFLRDHGIRFRLSEY